MKGAELILLIGVALTVLCLGLALRDPRATAQGRRIGRLRGRWAGEGAAAGSELSLVRDGGGQGGWERLVRRLLRQPQHLRLRLARAGSRLTLGRLAAFALLSAGMGGLLAAALGLGGLGSLCGGALGLALPDLWLRHRTRQRRERFDTAFPEAIGLIVRGLKSGLPVSESMQVVSREVPDPVGEEFRLICDHVRLGGSMDQVMAEAVARIDIPEFNFFTVTLAVQRETGGNLAETLENLDNILRRRRQMKQKVRAVSSEARASAFIIGSLPFIVTAVLSLLSPDYVAVLFTDPSGHTLLAAAGGSMLTGALIMARLVRFDI
ncbi:MAG TPA: type II secretion system F family protein [Alphaproteobacteria bacterium]|nr:type II secretion system F family protein [Alphaproteobacteria bacterium]